MAAEAPDGHSRVIAGLELAGVALPTAPAHVLLFADGPQHATRLMLGLAPRCTLAVPIFA